MSKKQEMKAVENPVVPGDKIAEIEEFLPDDTCFEEEGSILSGVIGEVITDVKKHKITVKPFKKHFEINRGDIGLGRVEYVKKQIASVDIYRLNEREVPLPVNSILHVSETSRRYVRSMYDVTRPGDWIKFRIIKTTKPIYISLIGEGLGVVLGHCNRCGHELDFYRRNSLKCANCNFIQNRITSKSFGKPLSSLKRPTK
jgi:exosome complex RNA-binding protein Csl4